MTELTHHIIPIWLNYNNPNTRYNTTFMKPRFHVKKRQNKITERTIEKVTKYLKKKDWCTADRKSHRQADELMEGLRTKY